MPVVRISVEEKWGTANSEVNVVAEDNNGSEVINPKEMTEAFVAAMLGFRVSKSDMESALRTVADNLAERCNHCSGVGYHKMSCPTRKGTIFI